MFHKQVPAFVKYVIIGSDFIMFMALEKDFSYT